MTADVDRETRIWRAMLVQSHGPDGVDALDALAHWSNADPFEVDE